MCNQDAGADAFGKFVHSTGAGNGCAASTATEWRRRWEEEFPIIETRMRLQSSDHL